jgi:hypothetical protein
MKKILFLVTLMVAICLSAPAQQIHKKVIKQESKEATGYARQKAVNHVAIAKRDANKTDGYSGATQQSKYTKKSKGAYKNIKDQKQKVYKKGQKRAAEANRAFKNSQKVLK